MRETMAWVRSRVEPPAQRGFGSRLIERTLDYEFDAVTQLSFAPAGVRCHIELLLSRIAVPEVAHGLSMEGGYHVVELDGAARVRARTVVLATGVTYRRLRAARNADFEGLGIYYAATQAEAQMCAGDPVLIVGGGNSAGQAAMFLSQHAVSCRLLIRGDDLAKSMSRYLVDEIERRPQIEVLTHREVVEIKGEDMPKLKTVGDAVDLIATRAGA